MHYLGGQGAGNGLNFTYAFLWVGGMFGADLADTCAKKLPLMSMGAERSVARAQTRERGPPSA